MDIIHEHLQQGEYSPLERQHLQGGTCPFAFKIKMMMLELRDKKGGGHELCEIKTELIREMTETDLLLSFPESYHRSWV